MGAEVRPLRGGWTIDRIAYSPIWQHTARELIPVVRRTLDDLPSDALQGIRFRDNESILVRVESMFSEPEFMTSPRACISAALVDAARSDYWYANEKDYGDEPELPEIEFDSDDGC